METTKTFKVNKGLAYLLKARGVGYYDHVQNFDSVKNGTILKLPALIDYDGLKMKQIRGIENADILDFENTILPWKWEYRNCLDKLRYCLMPVGYNYDNIVKCAHKYNVDIEGNITIKEGNVSGFSTNDYIRLEKPFNPKDNTWEIKLKFTTGNDLSSKQRIFHSCKGAGESNRFGLCFSLYQGNFNFFGSSDGTSWLFDLVGSHTFLPNTTYYVILSFDGSKYSLKYSFDNIDYIEDAFHKSSSPIYSSLSYSYLGVYSGESLREPFLGSIDLSETYIKINDELWWAPVITEIPEETANVLDGGIQSDGIMTSYVPDMTRSPTLITVYKDKSFEGVWRVKTPSNTTNDCHFIQTIDNGFYIRTGSGRFWGVVSLNGSETYGYKTVSTNTWYWVKIQYNPTTTELKWSYSTDGNSWTSIYAKQLGNYFFNSSSDNTTFSFDLYFGSKYCTTSSDWDGVIDFKNSHFKVDDEIVWHGTKIDKESLTGCTYNYNDTGEQTTLNCFVVNGNKSIVLTPDENYPNARFLGKTTIETHQAYDYKNGKWVAK